MRGSDVKDSEAASKQFTARLFMLKRPRYLLFSQPSTVRQNVAVAGRDATNGVSAPHSVRAFINAVTR